MNSDSSGADLDPVGRLAEVFAERLRRGERPSLTEYTSKYPELAGELHELFPALAVMEQLKPGVAERTCTFAGTTTGADAPHRRLGDFHILREVGRGGMGVVYEAEQESLDRHVALKVLPAHSLSDPRTLLRFRREARAAARLHHTNIVPVFGVGEHDGTHYYVMQLIQGRGLDEVLRELKQLRHGKPSSPVEPVAGRRTAVSQAGAVSATDVVRVFLTGHVATSLPGSDDSGRGMPSTPVAPTEPFVGAKGESDADPGRPGQAGDEAHSSTEDTPSASERTSAPDLTAPPEASRHYWKEVARVGEQVARALEYAHTQGILHRDIKPSNLLLDLQGTVWVTDFGLAKAVADADLTHFDDFVGTLRYMAPERFNGLADARSDLYALGLTLYELATLRPAFDATDRNQLIRQITDEEPMRPRKLVPEIPRDLETIILKAITRDPACRYQTADQLAGDLQRFHDDKPIQARPVGWLERGWKWAKRNPAIAGSLASLLVVVILAFAAVTWQWRKAVAARDEALEHSYWFMNAADKLFGQISEDPELRLPGRESIRKKVLGSAIGLFSQFAHNRYQEGIHGQNESAQYAMSKMQAGAIAADVGRWDEAETNLQAAVLALEWQGRLRPDLFPVRTGLARCHQLLTEVQRAKGDHARAESSARQAITLLEGLVADYPHLPAFRRYLGQCHDLVGVSRTERGSPGTAGPSFLRAVVALNQALSGSSGEAAAKRTPDDLAAERALAGVYLHLGAMHQALGRSAEAEQAALQAVEVYEALSAHDPVERSHFDLAQGFYALGRMRIDAGDPPRADPPLQRAYQILKKLDHDFPCAAAYRESLAKVAAALDENRKIRGQAPRPVDPPSG